MKTSILTFRVVVSILFGFLSIVSNAMNSPPSPSLGIDEFLNFFLPAIRMKCPESSFIALKFRHGNLQSEENFIEFTYAVSSPEGLFGLKEGFLQTTGTDDVDFESVINLSNAFEIHFQGLNLGTLDLGSLQNLLTIYCNGIVKVILADCIIESMSFLKLFEKLKEVSFVASVIMHLSEIQDLEFQLIDKVAWNDCFCPYAGMPIVAITYLWESLHMRKIVFNIFSDEVILTMSQLFPSLNTLMLTINDGFLRDLLVLSKLPNIRSLHLLHSFVNKTTTIMNLDLLISVLPNLEELTVHCMDVVDFAETHDLSQDAISPNHPFKQLIICKDNPTFPTFIRILNAENLPKFEAKFKNLEKIILNGCAVDFGPMVITEQDILNVMIPDLKKISLNENIE